MMSHSSEHNILETHWDNFLLAIIQDHSLEQQLVCFAEAYKWDALILCFLLKHSPECGKSTSLTFYITF